MLRSGTFPALHIAAHLEIKNIIPVYFMYQNGQITKRFEIPKLITPLPEKLNILICDSCLTSGNTLKSALHELKIYYPNANYYAAIVWLEEGVEQIDGIKTLFFGKRTNEHKKSITPDTINGIVVAPWEDLDVDWNEIKNY